MKKSYTPPGIVAIGEVHTLTAAFGTASRPDFSEFPSIPVATGSFDVCDGNPANNPPGSNCMM